MIRTARILIAGLLHVLAAKIDVHDTYIVDVDLADALAENERAVRAHTMALDEVAIALDEQTAIQQRLADLGRWN